jgi:hypothetical protein
MAYGSEALDEETPPSMPRAEVEHLFEPLKVRHPRNERAAQVRDGPRHQQRREEGNKAPAWAL